MAALASVMGSGARLGCLAKMKSLAVRLAMVTFCRIRLSPAPKATMVLAPACEAWLSTSLSWWELEYRQGDFVECPPSREIRDRVAAVAERERKPVVVAAAR